jgi:hypothetical protein
VVFCEKGELVPLFRLHIPSEISILCLPERQYSTKRVLVKMSLSVLVRLVSIFTLIAREKVLNNLSLQKRRVSATFI